MVNPYPKRSIPLLMVACFLSLPSRFPSFHEYFSLKMVFVSCYPVNPPLFRLTRTEISALLMPWDKAWCMPNRAKRKSGGCGNTCHGHQ